MITKIPANQHTYWQYVLKLHKLLKQIYSCIWCGLSINTSQMVQEKNLFITARKFCKNLCSSL